MKLFFIKLFIHLGFCGPNDFVNSWLRPTDAPMFILFSLLASYVTISLQTVFGLKPIMFFALFVIWVLELFTGVMSAKSKGHVIRSRRAQRFGVMVFVWLGLIYLANSMVSQFDGMIEEHAAQYMHSMVIFYIAWVYTKSIGENVDTMWKNRFNLLEFVKDTFRYKSPNT